MPNKYNLILVDVSEAGVINQLGPNSILGNGVRPDSPLICSLLSGWEDKRMSVI